ncbi:MAG: hypothetical protein QOI41_7507 [Myxococcales bacterium]|nr:hypothetical protein [Myxococcales bacterium]
MVSGCGGAPKCPQAIVAAPAPTALVVSMPAATPLTAAGAVDVPSSAMTDDMMKASATLDRFHAAAAAADEAAYFGLFAEGGVFLGTDGKERWTVPQFRAYAHPRFASGKAWSFRATRRDLSVRGDVAWFDEDLATPNLGPARGSGALLRDAQGAWKVVQYNLSVPIPNERFADVKTVIEGGGLPCKGKTSPGY